jgi:hypothetical protein
MSSTKWMLIPLLLAASAYATEPRKPACNSRNHGSVWVGQTTKSGRGPTEMCSLQVWKFRWTPLTVDVSQLAKESSHKAPRQSQPAPAVEPPTT